QSRTVYLQQTGFSEWGVWSYSTGAGRPRVYHRPTLLRYLERDPFHFSARIRQTTSVLRKVRRNRGRWAEGKKNPGGIVSVIPRLRPTTVCRTTKNRRVPEHAGRADRSRK